MERWISLLVVVTVLWALLSPVQAGSVEVNAGKVYETNIIVEHPLSGTSWVGIYTSVAPLSSKKGWDYFLTPFAQITNLSPSNVQEAELNLSKSVGYTGEMNNWYAVISPSSDANLYDLNSTCEENIDLLIEGNFCDDCVPSKTYDENAWILVNDRNLCSRKTLLYGSIPAYLLEWNGFPVYLSPLNNFSLDGNTYNAAFLVSADGNDLYFYLTRKNTFCGDGVCDPGETNCADCISLTITVSPSVQEINAGGLAPYAISLTNNGENNLYVSLSLRAISSPGSYSASFSEGNLYVPAGETANTALMVGAADPGNYAFQVIGTVNGVEVPSNTFNLIVKSTTTEENESGGGGGGGAPPPETNNVEENLLPTEENRVVVTPRGYYLPWLGCISYLHVFSPDSVTLYLDENRYVPVVVQNVGTCDENISFSIGGVEKNFYELDTNIFTLPKRKTRTLQILFKGYKPGVYHVRFSAKGYYTSTRDMTLIVKGESVQKQHCTSNILLLAPDVVEAHEGEEFNSILEVRNEGTCIEPVSLKLTKKSVGGAEIIVDARNLKLPEGERFDYKPPRLAAGEYTLSAKAGNISKTVSIIIKPQSAVSNLAEQIVVQARYAILLFLLIMLLGAISYVRSRYFST